MVVRLECSLAPSHLVCPRGIHTPSIQVAETGTTLRMRFCARNIAIFTTAVLERVRKAASSLPQPHPKGMVESYSALKKEEYKVWGGGSVTEINDCRASMMS